MPNDHSPAFLSCDWGTTSFRLRLVQNSGIIKQFSDSTGCRAVFDKSSSDTARREAFEEHLRNVAGPWQDAQFTSLPLVISGMASSTIGWHELPYASLPLKLNASNLRAQLVHWSSPAIIGKTYLVSGAASETEMMRGEETEAIGLFHSLSAAPIKATLVLPGTHSKHLIVQDGAIIEIQTYMTGEVYDVLAKYSILRASIEASSPVDPDAFEAGVHRARTHGLARSLFQTRTRQVLQKHPPASNASFLSGMLIGAELAELHADAGLLIAGPDSLRELYSQAATHLGLHPAHVFSPEEVQLAVPIAHELILSGLLNS